MGILFQLQRAQPKDVLSHITLQPKAGFLLRAFSDGRASLGAKRAVFPQAMMAGTSDSVGTCGRESRVSEKKLRPESR